MSNSSRIGATAIDVVGTLLDLHPEIDSLALFEPAAAPLAQERLDQVERSKNIIESGLSIRRDFALPFWDSVLLSCFGTGLDAFPIIENALFHNSPPRRQFWVASKDWSANHLARFVQEVALGQILVVSSRVRLRDESYRHIPMVDFHCPVGKANQEMSARVAKLLHPTGGYLLDSGQSYHFYGRSLIPEAEFTPFLGHALLLSPIIDRAWIAHQLIEGACGLRISRKPDTSIIPSVVQEL
jgi:hypothetical protein